MNAEIYARFDAPFSRTDTESVKWDMRAELGNADALPLWIADMDFPTAEGVISGLSARTAHGAFGYSLGQDRDRQALTDWYASRHGCSFTPDDILFCPGVVDGLYHALCALYPKGSRIVIQPPVYGPFFSVCEKAGMQAVENPLVRKGGKWQMDFEGLEEIFKAGAQALMLCSPQNPVGRIWTKAELETLAALCRRYSVRIIADEIHCDFELEGKHTNILSVPGAQDAIMLVSATKTFNLAALRHSAVVCRDEQARKKLSDRLSEVMADVNLFGRLATRLAYTTGAEWLDTLLVYLREGRDILERGILDTGRLLPTHVEGTYLMWVDCRALGLAGDALRDFFVKTAGVIPNEGKFFGPAGEGFVRLNFATCHENLREAVKRIKTAVNELKII